MREALDRAGDHYAEYLPGGDPRRGGARRHRRGARGGPLPGARSRVATRALRRLAFDELLALQLGMVGRRRQRGRDAAEADRASTTPATRRCGRRVIASIRREARRRRRRSRPTRTRRSPRSATTWPARPRCSASSRATSAAARPRSRRGRWARRRSTAGRAPCSRRRICSPASTTRRWPALLEDAGVPVELLTGSQTAAAASHVRDLVKSGQAPVVVGTHALIQERVEFADLGVVVIDEQHRFGVEQRGQLEAKAGGHAPHVLLMTATPIPRTLGQVLYADLDVSDLRTPPAGRIPIRTGIRQPDQLGIDLGPGPRRRRPPATGRSSSCP